MCWRTSRLIWFSRSNAIRSHDRDDTLAISLHQGSCFVWDKGSGHRSAVISDIAGINLLHRVWMTRLCAQFCRAQHRLMIHVSRPF